MCFSGVFSRNCHFIKTLISKISSKVKMAFEKYKKLTLLIQLNQHTAIEKQC